ncbi:hypothetical protein [Agrobacterium larrymoorei]|uniref:Uncharacterized protein n=1 Tax=Agrobacterium larrymoorei TaxID=160699 RepID=A0ABU0UIE4_9HYPH|nr:hypothetical protein [Agrobacterium larrymoorei]MDQ1184707.1 hypothetical protein [Agrobacterium larrymoorei]
MMRRSLTLLAVTGAAFIALGSVAAAPLAHRPHDWHPDRFTTIAPGVAEQLGGR